MEYKWFSNSQTWYLECFVLLIMWVFGASNSLISYLLAVLGGRSAKSDYLTKPLSKILFANNRKVQGWWLLGHEHTDWEHGVFAQPNSRPPDSKPISAVRARGAFLAHRKWRKPERRMNIRVRIKLNVPRKTQDCPSHLKANGYSRLHGFYVGIQRVQWWRWPQRESKCGRTNACSPYGYPSQGLSGFYNVWPSCQSWTWYYGWSEQNQIETEPKQPVTSKRWQRGGIWEWNQFKSHRQNWC